MKLKKVLDESFKTNVAEGKKVTPSNTRGASSQFAGTNLTDGDFDTYWATDDAVHKASITIDLKKATLIYRILLQEYIPLGQRIAAFSVDYLDGKNFRELQRQTTVGYKRILTFPTIQTSKVRINILRVESCAGTFRSAVISCSLMAGYNRRLSFYFPAQALQKTILKKL